MEFGPGLEPPRRFRAGAFHLRSESVLVRSPFSTHTPRNMKKIIHILAIASVALVGAGLSSCGCCSGEAEVPPLQPLPQFKEIPQVHYGK